MASHIRRSETGGNARKVATHPRLRGPAAKNPAGPLQSARLGLVGRAERKYNEAETGGLGNNAGIIGEECYMNSNNSNHSRAASARGFLARFAITPLAALGILAGTVPAARAADATCPPTNSGTINGILDVPPAPRAPKMYDDRK